MKHWLLIAVLMIGPAAPGIADDGAPEFFEQLRHAVETHPEVLARIAGQRAARQARREARAGYLPTLDLSLGGASSFSRRFEDNLGNIVESTRPRTQANATVTGSQTVFDAGATANRVAGAAARIGSAEQQVLATAADVAVEAVAAYLEVGMQRGLIRLGEEYVLRHRTIFDQVRLRYDQGVGALRDVTRVEARLADAQARLAGFERGLADAESRYAEFYGDIPGELGSPAAVTSDAGNPDQAVDIALARNPAVQLAAQDVLAAGRDYRAQRASLLPNLSVAVDATKFDLFENRDDYDVRGRVVMNYNLYSGGADSARVAQAMQHWRQAEHDEDRIAREIERDVRSAYRQLGVLEAQIAVLQRAAAANGRSLEIYLEQFRVARGSLIDLLQVEEDYFAAAVALLNGVTERDIARYRLLARTGELLDAIGLNFSFASAGELFGGE